MASNSMRAIQVPNPGARMKLKWDEPEPERGRPNPGARMKLVEIPAPKPAPEQVLIKVHACGVSHGDAKVIEGAASEYPRIPGHEVVGEIWESVRDAGA